MESKKFNNNKNFFKRANYIDFKPIEYFGPCRVPDCSFTKGSREGGGENLCNMLYWN